jgi:hypothetical protein
MATTYVCGKCEGTDWYPAVQVMNSGGANWGTKRIEVATCRKCDITMRKVSTSGLQGKNSPWLYVIISALLLGSVALTLIF